ncbi:MAG: transposase [Salinibacter sp.]
MADRHLIAFTANYPLTARLEPGMIDSLFEGMKAFVNEHPHVAAAFACLELAYWPSRPKPIRPHLHGILAVPPGEISVRELLAIWRENVPVDDREKDENIVHSRPIQMEPRGLRGWMKYMMEPLSRKGRWSRATAAEKAHVKEVLHNKHRIRQHPHAWPKIKEEIDRHGLERFGNDYDRSLLSDAEWERIWPFLLDTRPENGGRPAMDRRTVLEGILWYLHRGGRWRDLPAKYGSYKTISSRFSRWKQNGTWAEVAPRLDQAPPQQ